MINETIEMRTKFGILNKIRLIINVISSLPIIPIKKGTHKSKPSLWGSLFSLVPLPIHPDRIEPDKMNSSCVYLNL